MTFCRNYTCSSCINGNCPIALSEEYNERGIPVPNDCSECSYYLSCKGCDWYNTDVCREDWVDTLEVSE